jgi:hypothetical protein
MVAGINGNCGVAGAFGKRMHSAGLLSAARAFGGAPT